MFNFYRFYRSFFIIYYDLLVYSRKIIDLEKKSKKITQNIVLWSFFVQKYDLEGRKLVFVPAFSLSNLEIFTLAEFRSLLLGKQHIFLSFLISNYPVFL